nr:MAG TPA: minor capsid protein [Caudoviricetes sp.]
MRQQYEPSADRIIALYQQLEDDILSAVIRRILKMGYVSEASKHQLEVLQAAGLLYDDIVQLIADRTDACTAQVKALFEDAGVQTVEIDNSLHEAAGALPIDIRQDSSTRQVLEAGYKKTLGTMQNLVSTTATQTQTAFIQICDRIYMQVSSGAFSYQEAIMNALRALADTGATVSYPTGHTDRMDVAVRRCVLTGASQTAAAVSLRQAEDAGCYLMEITAHSGARPDHAKWQGQLVTITGKNAGKIIDGLRVFTLSEIGYGSGEGFKGWNCRHNWHAYYPGFSTPNYTPEELKKLDEPCISYNGKLYTEYEVSQMQRAQERRVRAWKRRCITAQEGVNSATDEATRATAQAEYSKSAVHLKANEEKLKDFCKQTGQNRDRFREQVYGFGRSEAQRAVQANNSSFRNTMRQKGIKNPPKSLAELEKMKYNNPKEYDLMQSYSKSVDSGMMSPLVGYEKYKEYHKRVEKELIGLTTSNGITIKSQSKHFLERVFGTISDPSHDGVMRTGVELEDVKEALLYGKVEKVKIKRKRNGELDKSQRYCTDKCFVSVNPDKCILIQVIPKK